jgi:hypothetical protein
MRIELAVSAGELIDRMTILELKLARLPEHAGAELTRELGLVRGIRERELSPSACLDVLTDELRVVNAQLWDLEEVLRTCEHAASFGERFVALARQVYKANDRRAALKRGVDELVGSEIREHKSHALPVIELAASMAGRLTR